MHPSDLFHAVSRPFRRAFSARSAAAPFLVAVFALAGVRAVGVGLVQMPFNGWDELPHIAVAYAVHTTGRMPTPRTPMPRELVPFITAHPHPTTSLSMLRGIDARPYPGGSPACGIEPAKRFDMFLYQAQHGPLFYHLAALFCPGPDPARLLAWVDGVRLFNAALLLLTLGLWRFALGRCLPARGPLAWLPDGVLLLCAGFSYVAYDFVRFANDGLALFLGSAALALAVAWKNPVPRPATSQAWRGATLGALTGLAVLAKATALPLVPVLGLLLAWPCLGPGRTRRERLAALTGLAAFVCGYAAVAGPYHWPYLVQYGQLTGMQEAIYASRRGFGLGRLLLATRDLGYGLFRNPVLYNAMPHVAGWSNLSSPTWLNQGFKLALSGCALALGAALVRPQARRQAGRLMAAAPELPLLFAFCTLALFFHALHSTLAWGFPTTGSWYAMAALPALFLLLLLGPALLGPRAGLAALFFLAVLCNVAYLGGTYDTLLAEETGQAGYFAAFRIAAGHHALGGPRLALLPFVELACLAVALGLAARRVLAGRQVRVPRAPLTLLHPAPGPGAQAVAPFAAPPLATPAETTCDARTGT
uniref:Glycosyltransferase RgtA/B/C/D-like domain-containing protein n=1 Tax=Desulfovibrio sp. U5L TaxID=596152 RepID=I2Q7G6_9BACT